MSRTQSGHLVSTSPPPGSAGGRTPSWHLGARLLPDGRTAFRVWAPQRDEVAVHIMHPDERIVPLQRATSGYFEGIVDDCPAGTRYYYRLDGTLDRPDPASRHQPQGVHGPSEVVAPFTDWTDQAWSGLPLEDCVIYELHVGTFTEEGTFDAIIPHLDRLADLGVTVVELMPVAQFPGGRNWGYDGVLPFAVQDTYGGPHGLDRLVDACHARGLGVAMDVVYNHMGPEGNHLADFGPYFTKRYNTPWGDALNFDDRDSDEVRHYFIENARHWITEHHIDMLRLDAIHVINDRTAKPFLHELTEAVHARARSLHRRVQVIAESAANEPRLLRPRSSGGYGMDGQWNDDFHHALHVLLTGERHGYYVDFSDVDDLAKAYRQGFIFTGQHSRYRGRRHGAPPHGIDPGRFVVYAQNHDQTGNRFRGERLPALTDPESVKLGAAAMILSPGIPMLFMGEEHGEDRPFLYFTSHTDPDLQEAVRKGRAEEGRRFGWTGDAPDPGAEETFATSRVDHTKCEEGHGARLWRLHQTLLMLRREVPALGAGGETLGAVRADLGDETLYVERVAPPTADRPSRALVVHHFGRETLRADVRLPRGTWRRVLATAATEWDGPGAPGTDVVEADDEVPVRLEVAPRSSVVYVDANDPFLHQAEEVTARRRKDGARQQS